VAGLDKLDGGDVRASDRDRTRITEELRLHCAAGRISVEELEHRLELAMSALTIHQLAELVIDLPAVAVPRMSPRAPLRVGPPGNRPFPFRFVVPCPVERTRTAVLDSIAAALNRGGWELRHQSASSLVFRRSTKERLVIDLEPHGSSETTMIVHGRAPRYVRRQFAKLNLS
jgi:hypothetical protein